MSRKNSSNISRLTEGREEVGSNRKKKNATGELSLRRLWRLDIRAAEDRKDKDEGT